MQPLALGAGLSAAPCGPCKARHVGFGGLDCAGECAGGYDAVAHATSTSNCTKLPVVAVLNTTNVGRGRFEIDFPTNIQAVTLLAAVSFPKDKTSDHTGPSDDRELVLGLGELALHWVDDVPANIAISATAACAPGSGNQLVSEGATFDMSSSYLDDAGDLWDEPWLGSALGWSADTTDGEWVSIDIGSGQEIIGVVTQGATYEDTDGILPEYVESFKVQASVDGVSWSDVDDGAIFKGNSDADTEVFNKFASHVHGRYLRIVPETWEEWPTLRFGAVLLACKSCEGGTFAAEAGLRPCTRCESGYSCGSREGCVGVESFEAPAATFSSVDDEYNDSVLDVGIGWSVSEEAESSGSAGDHWIQLDTGALRGIRGVITQGIIYESLPEYVESFTVQASVDGVSWSDVDDGAIFTGNSDGEHHLVNDFATILYARYVKIVPETWEGWPSLRVGVRFAGDDARGYCGEDAPSFGDSFAAAWANGTVLRAIPGIEEAQTLALTFDGVLLTLYVDGEWASDAHAAGLAIDPIVLLGSQGSAGTELNGTFSGQVYEARVYAEALTATQVREMSADLTACLAGSFRDLEKGVCVLSAAPE